MGRESKITQLLKQNTQDIPAAPAPHQTKKRTPAIAIGFLVFSLVGAGTVYGYMAGNANALMVANQAQDELVKTSVVPKKGIVKLDKHLSIIGL